MDLDDITSDRREARAEAEEKLEQAMAEIQTLVTKVKLQDQL
jgi:hypothetical protein